MISLSKMTALFGAAVGLCLSSSAMATSLDRIYDSIPKNLTGNVASLGFEATSTKEFGDGIVFTPGAGGWIDEVRIVLSSWGCFTGRWNTGNCVTPAGRKFRHPITLRIYEVATGGPNGPDGFKKGDLLYAAARTFDIPYRPSANASKCDAGEWYDSSDEECYNGIATEIEFKLPFRGIVVPDRVIITLSYNTTHYGYTPIGEAAACFTSSGGCPYDSLNVGAEGDGGPVGGVVDTNGIFINWGGTYCAPHVDEGDVIEIDTSTDPACSWAGYHPLIEVTALTRKKFRPRPHHNHFGWGRYGWWR